MQAFFCLITLLYGSYSLNLGKIAQVQDPIEYVKANANVYTKSTISKAEAKIPHLHKYIKVRKNTGTNSIISNAKIFSPSPDQLEKGGFCGLKDSVIKNYLTPPKPVKEFIAFAFGLTFDIGRLNESSNAACVELGKSIGDVKVAWVGLAPSPLLGHIGGPEKIDESYKKIKNKLVGGTATKEQNKAKCLARGEGEKTCTDKVNEDKTEGKFASAYTSIPMPLCMAVRPCDISGGNLFREWTFGFRCDGIGLPIFATVAPPVKISLTQLTFSSSGHLTTSAADKDFPPLIDVVKHKSWGMHVFLETKMEVPMVAVEGQPKFKIAGTGGVGVLGKVTLANGGELRSPAQFFSWFLETGGDLQKILTKFRKGGDAFQSVEFELNVLLTGTLSLEFGALAPPKAASKSLISLNQTGDDDEEPPMIGITAKSRNVIQVRLDRSGKSQLQFWSSFEASIPLTDIFQTIPFIKDIIPDVTASATVSVYGGIKQNGETDFIGLFKLGLALKCGKLRAYVKMASDTITEMCSHSVWGHLCKGGGLKPLQDIIAKADKFLVSICEKETSVSIQFRLLKGVLDTNQTFIAYKKTKLRLSDLPYCPETKGIKPSHLPLKQAHKSTASKCSKDKECHWTGDAYHTGSYHGQEGYCLFHPTFKTSLGCLGRCVKKIAPGGSCAMEHLNSPVADNGITDNFVKTLLGINTACQSGSCVCGTCTDFKHNGGKVPDGGKCRWATDCASDWCEGQSKDALLCGGTCRPKRENGQEAWHGATRHWEGSCKSGYHECGTCVVKSDQGQVPNGNKCRFAHHCISGWCEGEATTMAACQAVCRPKRANGQEAWHGTTRHWEASCQSNFHLCGTCVTGYNQVPNGNNCRKSSHCQSGWCEGSTYEAAKCVAKCRAKKDDGEEAWNGWDSSCVSGVEECGTCLSGEYQIPNGRYCNNHKSCRSGQCSGGYYCHATCQ